MTGTVFNIQNAWWAVDFLASIIVFLLLFSVLFLVFPNILLFFFLTVDEDLGDIFIKLSPSSLSQLVVNFTVCL